jgi:hypothetical protein
MRTLLAVSLFLLVTACVPAYAGTIDRCRSYSQDVRTAHIYYFGLDFPWHYSVAQLQQESLCRDVISRDGIGSQGAAQITYRWWRKPLAKVGIDEISSRKGHLRAQAYINWDAWGQSPRKLWVSYQIYNGGRLVLKEIKRAGAVDHTAARAECRRKIIRFNNGQEISACDINYEYSERISRFAERYRLIEDPDRYQFW